MRQVLYSARLSWTAVEAFRWRGFGSCQRGGAREGAATAPPAGAAGGQRRGPPASGAAGRPAHSALAPERRETTNRGRNEASGDGPAAAL